MFVATMFDSIGNASTGKGRTPEDALTVAAAEHGALCAFTITYRPADGVIFADGKPCGVVYESYLPPNNETFHVEPKG